MVPKHFSSDPLRLVSNALRALQITNPSIVLDEQEKVVRLRSPPAAKPAVSIISGGGSGHEPAFGAYVGRGLLTAAVAGTIFASPSSRQILHAIEASMSDKGVLVTVMNYTGDVLNFGVAVEKAKARNPNAKIEMLIVGDDVGVPRSRAGKVGRRGIAGTCLVHKITGAAAAAEYELGDVLRLGKLVCENLVSVGASLDRVHVPGQEAGEQPDQQFHAGEVELGMGIHNEFGSGRRSGEDAELPALVKEMLRQLLSAEDQERAFLKDTGTRAVLLVNNLGGLSVLELGAVTTEVVIQLHTTYKVESSRVYSGTFMSSLNGPGFSISLLFLQPTGLSADLIELLDAPSEAIGWSAPVTAATWDRAKENQSNALQKQKPRKEEKRQVCRLVCDLPAIIGHLEDGLNAVIAAEPEITRFDTIVGDGDCGTTMKRGAEALLEVCRSSTTRDLMDLVLQISDTVEQSMDGTSGALYSIFLNSFAIYFASLAQGNVEVDRSIWVSALEFATNTLAMYTPAEIGDRTLVDALHPFLESLLAGNKLKTAAKAAVEGAERTRTLTAKLGRTVYVGNGAEWVGKVPDPGAWGLSKFFWGIAGPWA